MLIALQSCTSTSSQSSRTCSLLLTFRTMATTTYTPPRPRRFAPLDPSIPNANNAPKLKGVVFDVDGTLCLPQNYMFKEMRSALGIPKSIDIIEHINSLSARNDQNFSSPRSRAQDAIKKIEREAMRHQRPQPGLNELITRLAKWDIRLALCTRNFEMPVKHLLEKFVSEEGRAHFSPLITRETEGIKAKPSPEGIWACVQVWNQTNNTAEAADVVDGTIKLEEGSDEDKMKGCDGVIMVGDSADDIEAGARAGAATVLLVNEENRHLLNKDEGPRVDLSIERLTELVDVLEQGFEGRS